MKKSIYLPEFVYKENHTEIKNERCGMIIKKYYLRFLVLQKRK